MNRVLELLVSNANGIAFVLGAAWCYHGLARWSPTVADATSGLLLMAIAAWPYLRRPRKP